MIYATSFFPSQFYVSNSPPDATPPIHHEVTLQVVQEEWVTGNSMRLWKVTKENLKKKNIGNI